MSLVTRVAKNTKNANPQNCTCIAFTLSTFPCAPCFIKSTHWYALACSSLIGARLSLVLSPAQLPQQRRRHSVQRHIHLPVHRWQQGAWDNVRSGDWQARHLFSGDGRLFRAVQDHLLPHPPVHQLDQALNDNEWIFIITRSSSLLVVLWLSCYGVLAIGMLVTVHSYTWRIMQHHNIVMMQYVCMLLFSFLYQL